MGGFVKGPLLVGAVKVIYIVRWPPFHPTQHRGLFWSLSPAVSIRLPNSLDSLLCPPPVIPLTPRIDWSQSRGASSQQATRSTAARRSIFKEPTVSDCRPPFASYRSASQQPRHSHSKQQESACDLRLSATLLSRLPLRCQILPPRTLRLRCSSTASLLQLNNRHTTVPGLRLWISCGGSTGAGSNQLSLG